MNTAVEKLENNQAKLTFGVDAEQFEKSIQHAYTTNRSRFNIPGFRKGKAPRKIIEMQYGKEIFYEDAVNHCIGEAYENAADESDLDIVSKPEFGIEEIGTENGAIFTALVTLKPEAIINDYKGITYNALSVEVTDDDVLNELNKDREKNAREITVTDRAIQTGDIVTIKYEGFLDGVAFEGGSADDHDLEIGSNSFIDTFEDQLIGANIGDDLTINVTFPEQYHSEELAGKQTEFKVEIKDIRFRELPAIDDDFAADVSEFDTLEEYKSSIREILLENKRKEAERSKRNQLIDKLIAKSELVVPNVMVESQIDSEINNLARTVDAQGLNFNLYLQYMGQTIEGMRHVMRVPSENRVKGRLCLEAVAKAENIEISEEELNEEIKRISEEYKMDIENLKLIMNKKELANLALDLKVQKALDIIIENSIAVEEGE